MDHVIASRIILDLLHLDQVVSWNAYLPFVLCLNENRRLLCLFSFGWIDMVILLLVHSRLDSIL
jgi:hypothetical protein